MAKATHKLSEIEKENTCIMGTCTWIKVPGKELQYYKNTDNLLALLEPAIDSIMVDCTVKARNVNVNTAVQQYVPVLIMHYPL